jgi:hypothetical protein
MSVDREKSSALGGLLAAIEGLFGLSRLATSRRMLRRGPGSTFGVDGSGIAAALVSVATAKAAERKVVSCISACYADQRERRAKPGHSEICYVKLLNEWSKKRTFLSKWRLEGWFVD